MASTLHLRKAGADEYEVVDRLPGPYSASGPTDVAVFRLTAEDLAQVVADASELGVTVAVPPVPPVPETKG